MLAVERDVVGELLALQGVRAEAARRSFAARLDDEALQLDSV